MTDAAPPAVPDEAVDDLRRRLRAFRPVAVPGSGWSRGTDPEWLGRLVERWAEAYDWRAAESRIRDLPWVAAGGLRLVEQRGPAGAPVVVLLHGWPDSVLRFERVLPLLPDLTVVVPALPGYPFSGSAGSSGADMAAPVLEALRDLGHERFTVSGGDIGTGVAQAMALAAPERVAALHLTDVPDHLASVPDAERTPEERAFGAGTERWYRTEGGYEIEQSTKPATLAAGLGDSPAGLAAWIAEKLRSWSDCGGDVASVFPVDDLLTWVSAYWFTGAIGTSFAAYSEYEPQPMRRLVPPAVVSAFPADLASAPRSLAERFLDVRAWHEHDAGGHFAAWEQPEAFAADLRAAVALDAGPAAP